MSSCGSDALIERLDRLERECRRWRRAGMAAVIAALLLIGGGAALRTADEVKVPRLVIQEEDGGGESIVLELREGQPSLTFLSGGSEKVSLAATEGGGAQLTFSEGGASRLAFGLSQQGAPVVNLNDDQQRRRIALGIFPKVGPMISVLDEEGKVVSRVP